MSIGSMTPSNHLILCHPLLLLPSIFPSIRVFSKELALHIRCPKGWSFSFSISRSDEYSGLISFWMDWYSLAVQGTRVFSSTTVWKQIHWCSAFLMVQFPHPYMTPGKAIALTTWTFIGKVMVLLFNTLSGFVIAFLPRSKRLLISWLQSLSAVNLSLLLHFPLLLAMKWWDQVPWSWLFSVFRIQKTRNATLFIFHFDPQQRAEVVPISTRWWRSRQTVLLNGPGRANPESAFQTWPSERGLETVGNTALGWMG